METKTIIFVTDIITFLLIVSVYCLVYIPLKGSIIYRSFITKKAETYVSENFPGQDFEISKAEYNYKNRIYSCKIQSNKSVDTSFYVYKNKGQDDMYDDYDTKVEQKENTIKRISNELNDVIPEKIKSMFTYRTSEIICSLYDQIDYNSDDFELDMALDIYDLPHPAELCLWVETSDDDPTWEELSDKLVEISNIIDDLKLDIDYISMTMLYPFPKKTDDIKPSQYISEICAFDIPKEIINSENFAVQEFLSKH